MDQRTRAWALVVVGVIALALGLFVGVGTWAITLALVVIGLVALAVGGFMAIRSGRPN